MDAKEKILAVLFAIPIWFGVWEWFREGIFLMPFPLFNPILLFAAIIVLIFHRKEKDVILSLGFVLMALLKCLGDQMVLGFFMDQSQLDQLNIGAYYDLIKLGFLILCSSILVISTFQKMNRAKMIISLGLLPMFILFFFVFVPGIIGVFIVAGWLSFQQEHRRKYAVLWFLNAFFGLAIYCMLDFFG